MGNERGTMTEKKTMAIGELVELLAVRAVEGEHQGPGLLDQLRSAVWGDIGRTQAGASSVRSIPIDAGAFTIWEDLSGQIEAQFNGATDIRPNRSPAVNLMAWWAVFSAAIARGELTDLQVEVANERVQGWADKIQEYLGGGRTMELLIACPWCGRTRATTGDPGAEVEGAAIVVRLDDLVATCRQCNVQWVGDTAVIGLARLAGVELDVDAIRESRAPVPPKPVDEPARVVEDFDPENPEHVALLRQKTG